MIFVGRKDAYPVRYGWGAFVSSDPKSGPTVPPTRRKNLGRVTRDGFFLGFFLAVAFFLATTRRASATMTLARLDVVLFALFLDHAARWFVGARVTWAIFWALRVHASARPDVLFERARVASTLAARHPLHPLARAYPSATAAFAVARHVADALALRLALLAALLAVCPRPFAETAAHALAPTWLFVAWVERRSRTVESSPRGPTRPFPPSHEVRVWRRVVVPFETVLLVVAAVEYVACGFAHDSLKYRRAVAAAASAAAARGARLRIRAPPAWLRAYPALTAREVARRGVVAAVAPHLTLAFLLADFVDAARHSCAPRAGYATEPTAARANAPLRSSHAPLPTGRERVASPFRCLLDIVDIVDAACAIADDSRFRAFRGSPASRRCRRCRGSGRFANGACSACRRAHVSARRETHVVPAEEALDATLRIALEDASAMLTEPETRDVRVTLTSSPGLRRELAPFARKLERTVREEMRRRVAVALEGRRER